MATVINQPADQRWGQLGLAIGTGMDLRKKEQQKQQLADWLQGVQHQPTREDALKMPVPDLLKTPDGSMKYQTLINAMYPVSTANYYENTGGNPADRSSYKFVGTFASDKAPAGSLSEDVVKTLSRFPTTGGAKPTDQDKGVRAFITANNLPNTPVNRAKARRWTTTADKQVRAAIDAHVKGFNKDPKALFSDNPAMQAQRDEAISGTQKLYFSKDFRGTIQQAMKQYLKEHPMKLVEQQITGAPPPKEQSPLDKIMSAFSGKSDQTQQAAPADQTPQLVTMGRDSKGQAIVYNKADIPADLATNQQAQLTVIQKLIQDHHMTFDEASSVLDEYVKNAYR